MFEVSNFAKQFEKLGFSPTTRGYTTLVEQFNSKRRAPQLDDPKSLRQFALQMQRFNDRLNAPSAKLVQQHLNQETLVKYDSAAHLAVMIHFVGSVFNLESDGELQNVVSQLIVEHTWLVKNLKASMRAYAGNGASITNWEVVATAVANKSGVSREAILEMARGKRTRQDICARVAEGTASVCNLSAPLEITDMPMPFRPERNSLEAVSLKYLK
jgi:hypothetical protein